MASSPATNIEPTPAAPLSTTNSPAPDAHSSIFGPPEHARLVTIAAHVDHGKTTLADNLIESNGLISERAAGTLRYLDSDPEEQRRGITMRSSAIGLQHPYSAVKNTKKQQQKQQQNSTDTTTNMIVHLVDSPGHSDFSREVSTSMLACDGAVLVVDAVEGMGARTQQVFRETVSYQLTPILCINKIDRLQTELCLTPTEAYLRLRSLLETVNAAAASIVTTSSQQEQNNGDKDDNNTNSNLDKERLEKLWTFDPAAGNVIFASALFGWGFSVPALCRSLFRSHTVQIKPGQLRQVLFGDNKLSKNGEKILKWKQHPSSSSEEDAPLFAEFALQPIWSIYEGVATAAATVGLSNSGSSSNNKDAKIRADTVGMDQVVAALQTAATTTRAKAAATTTATTPVLRTAEELQNILTRTGSGSSEDATLRAILRRYRPLSDAVLDVVCEYCPSPATAASDTRSQALALQEPPTASEEFVRIRAAVQACDDGPDAPTVAHVCKFLSTDQYHVRDAELEQQQPKQDGGGLGENRNIILGLARVLSGRLRSKTAYHLFGPRHHVSVDQQQNPDSSTSSPPVRTVRLYLLMGSSFIRVEEVPAGHLCAVHGLEDVQLKTVTLSDSPACEPLRGFHEGVRPLVKVSIEPEKTADAEYLERGLAKLSLADAAVEVSATDKGERLLACLGELHLEQSVLDLERVYCEKEGIKLRISDPIVDFAETTDWFESSNNKEVENYTAFYDDPSPRLRHTTMPPYNEEEGIVYAKHGRTRAILHGKSAAIHLRVIPLAGPVYRSLKEGRIATDDSGATCEEELLKIGRALNCGITDNGVKLSAESVLQQLLDLMVSIDDSGNALVECEGLRDGGCVRGVLSEEIYLPAVINDAKVEKPRGSNYSGGGGGDENDNDGPPAKSLGADEFESLRDAIRTGGLSVARREDDTASAPDAAALGVWKKSIRGSVVAGFQNALRAGPICEEPMRNILVVVEGVEVAMQQSSNSDSYQASKSLAGGMAVSALRSGIRCALLSRPARLMEGHLKLTLHSSLAGLGPLYQVLSKRRGKVVEDSMVDGTDLLMITAMIPQAEAFGLTPELFSKTSGEVTAPEMLFSHWERLDVDPFWIPTSEEEREDFGELQSTGDSSTGLDNPALKYIRQVRKRKGLTVDSSRTVLNAEKQRTLKK